MSQMAEVGPNQGLNSAVLLIDEDLEQLEWVGRIIQGIGYRVQACDSYAAGMRQLMAGSFDVIIVGQGSPEFEGRCVLECASEFNRDLAVITVARHLEMSCYLEAMQLGAVDYLAGPFAVQEMARVMRTWAGRRKRGVEMEKPISGEIAERPVPLNISASTG
jgi:DNA-binding NtrC family response regulator